MTKSRVKCFVITDIGKYRISLRRYRSDSTCPLPQGYHTAKTVIAERSEIPAIDMTKDFPPGEDNRWPTECGCGYIFTAEDKWQVFGESLYSRKDTGEVMVINEAPPGAMWNAEWFSRKGPDGICLMVMTPGGEWMVDGRASNCTKPNDKTHYCWVRHGIPPEITVDKNGATCSAGAGSIQCGNYHGFLRSGYLEE